MPAQTVKPSLYDLADKTELNKSIDNSYILTKQQVSEWLQILTIVSSLMKAY